MFYSMLFLFNSTPSIIFFIVFFTVLFYHKGELKVAAEERVRMKEVEEVVARESVRAVAAIQAKKEEVCSELICFFVLI